MSGRAVTRVLLQHAAQEVEAALRDAFGDAVETVEMTAGPPPDGLAADVFFGGYGDWDHVLAWLDGTGVRWVQLSGTGIDKAPAALFEGRSVTCSRGASAVPISEFVLAAVLAFEKDLPRVWLHEPPKHWNFHRLGLVEGRTLGLVGIGGIGTAIATRALPFGMRVRALRRTDAPSPLPGVEVVTDFDELLATADHLVLAAPLTPRTRRLLDADAFARVKPGLHLVNVARGGLLDQEALRAALDDGRVARATLDVAEPEPLPAGNWLYSHPGVRLSAHVSWCSPRLFAWAIEHFVANLGRFVRGEPLADPADPDEGY